MTYESRRRILVAAALFARWNIPSYWPATRSRPTLIPRLAELVPPAADRRSIALLEQRHNAMSVCTATDLASESRSGAPR